MPFFFVDLGRIRAEVVAGPARFFTEQNRADVGFRLPHAVNVFPAAHQLMQVGGSQFHRVFLQEGQQFQRPLQARLRW